MAETLTCTSQAQHTDKAANQDDTSHYNSSHSLRSTKVLNHLQSLRKKNMMKARSLIHTNNPGSGANRDRLTKAARNAQDTMPQVDLFSLSTKGQPVACSSSVALLQRGNKAVKATVSSEAKLSEVKSSSSKSQLRKPNNADMPASLLKQGTKRNTPLRPKT